MADTASSQPGEISALTIPNEISALRKMSAWLQASLATQRMRAPWPFRFDLCANEAVSNIISYGYPQQGTHQIGLRLARLADNAVCLEIVDDGVDYNPLDRPPHSRPASLTDAAIGGLGVSLFQTLMSECQYQRLAGKNVLRLIARS